MRGFKLSITIVFSIFFVVLIALFSLPKLISTDRILEWVNSEIPGRIEAKSVHLNWFSKQAAASLKLYDPEGNLVLSADNVEVSSLAGFIFFPRDLKLNVSNLQGTIHRDAEGNSNLHRALGIESAKQTLSPLDITLLDFNGNLSLSDLYLDVSGRFISKGKEGSINLKGNGENKLEAAIKGFPVDLLEQFVSIQDPKLGKLLLAAIGDSLDLTLEHVTVDDQHGVKLRAISPRCLADLSFTLSSNAFVLASPGKAVLQLTPELLELLPDVRETEITLAKPMAIEAIFDRISIPLPLDLSRADMHATLNIGNALLTSQPSAETYHIHDLEAYLKKTADNPLYHIALKGYLSYASTTSKIDLVMAFDETLERLNTQGSVDPLMLPMRIKGEFLSVKFNVVSESLKEHHFNLNAKLAAEDQLAIILGPNGELSLSGIVTIDNRGSVELDELRLAFNSPQTTLELGAKLDKEQKISFTSTPQLSYTPTGAAFQAMGLNLPLHSMVPIKLSLDPLKQPVPLSELKNMQLTGNIWIDRLASNNAALSHTAIPWEINLAENTIKLSIQGQTIFEGQPAKGSVMGQATIQNWLKDSKTDFENATYNLQLQASKLPVSLLENYMDRQGLALLLGQSLDLKVKVAFNDPENDAIVVSVDGEGLKGSAKLKSEGKFFVLYDPKKPADLTYTLTPNRFEALKKMFNHRHAISLNTTSEFNASISGLKLALSGKGEFQSSLKVNRFRASDRESGQFFGFDQLNGIISSQDLSSQIDFSFHTLQTDQKGNTSDLVIKGELDNPIKDDGKINTDSMTVKLHADAKQLPAGMLCQLGCLERAARIKMEALLGPLVDVDIAVQLTKMQGPVKVQLQGSQGQLDLDGQINQGFLTLNKPLVATLIASPQLGESVLQDLVPVLGGMLSAENQLQLVINPEGFSSPIHLQSFEQMQVGAMMINLGKVHFSNQGQLGKIVSVFKAKPQDMITVWFTPVYISINNGLINLQRFDMLAMDIFPLAAWGTIDLPGNYIDMVVGLSGKSLQNAIGMPTIDKNYMMQFPYRGKIGKASVDKTKAAAKIAALTASLTGTPQGLAIGAMIGLASGSLTEEKAPQPTTSPFPWVSQDEVSDTPEQNKRHSKNPLQSLKKGASNLIDNIFR